MKLSPIPRCFALGLMLAACVQAQPAPPSPAPTASGAPTAIAANAGKGQYAFPAQWARQQVLSKGQEGAVRDKVRQCWNLGQAPQGQSRPVTIRVARINPDGTIPPGAASIADDGGNPAWANAALRAVTNPVCQPWPMPRGGWPDDSFVLVFDAKDFF
jgi:hypothetical protein